MVTGSISRAHPDGPDAPPTAPADVLLADGSVGVIRPLRLTDRDALFALHDEVGLESLRLRFFSPSREAGHAYVDHLLAQHDSGQVLALGLWHRHALAGLATAERLGDEAEVAFLVADELRGHGVGTLLLEHLAAAARTAGVRRFTAEVLAENGAMIRVFIDAGFEITRHLDRGVVTVEMDTQVSESALRAADTRESQAEAASLTALMRPRRVAVVGARRDGSGVGASVVDSIVQGGYLGDLVVIHPSAETIRGVPAYASFLLAPGPVDLVIVAVPPDQVTTCVEQAADAGARAAVVITSGFAETGQAGLALQRELTRTARARNIRVVGPNSLGLLDNQSDVRLSATFAGTNPPPGGLAIASQSGGVGIVVIDLARRLGLGVGHFVSLGNKADISSNDLLAAWADDPDVTAAALYLESFGNPAKFARVGRRFAESKPLLAVVGGQSGSSERAGHLPDGGRSHPGGPGRRPVRPGRRDRLSRRGGADRDRPPALRAAAPRRATPRCPRERRRAGRARVRHGRSLRAGGPGPVRGPAYTGRAARLRRRHHHQPGRGRSGWRRVRTWARSVGRCWRPTRSTLSCSCSPPPAPSTPGPPSAALAEARHLHPGKPMVAVLLGGLEGDPLPGITVLPSVDSAVRSLAHVMRYAAWLRTPRTAAPVTDPARLAVVRRWVTDTPEPRGDRLARPGRRGSDPRLLRRVALGRGRHGADRGRRRSCRGRPPGRGQAGRPDDRPQDRPRPGQRGARLRRGRTDRRRALRRRDR